ncbi:MAG: hypothetical protein M3081_11500 [Gemmatimonadota bacterium]|nr:hypothetical protein [Gemmatimonadota bacterium]
MSEDTPQRGGINISIGGDASGQLVAGDRNSVSWTTITTKESLTDADREQLREHLRTAVMPALAQQVEAEVPPEMKEKALERVEELQAAVTADEPDVSTMEYVWKWFKKNAPTVAGTVLSVVVNPIVGKLVQAAGDAVVGEFGRRFGTAPEAGAKAPAAPSGHAPAMPK